MALNLARDDGRRAARQGRKLELLRGEASGASAPSPDLVLEADEQVTAVRAALATLDEQDRSALLLKAEGFSYDDIAAALGLAKGSIGTTLARARKRLVEAFRARGQGNHVTR